MIYSIGWLVGWPIILFLIVEPLRNVGRFTFADVVAYRLSQRPVRLAGAVGTLAVILFYLIAQMVATGSLIKLLFGLPYTWSWCSWSASYADLRAVRRHAGDHLGAGGQGGAADGRRRRARNSGADAFRHEPAETVRRRLREVRHEGAAAGIQGRLRTMGCDFAGARPDVRHRGDAARPDAGLYGEGFQGGAAVDPLRHRVDRGLPSHGVHHRLRRDGAGRPRGRRESRRRRQHGGAAARLAVGGNAFFGFICAVAFATMLAVVAGLTLSGVATICHDVWTNVVRNGTAPEAEQLKVARVATVAISILAIDLGIAFEGQNVAFMAGLAFSIACAANFPALVLAITWRRFTTSAAVASILVGTLSSLVLIYLSPTIQVDVLGKALSQIENAWWFVSLRNPAIICMPLSFAVAIIAVALYF